MKLSRQLSLVLFAVSMLLFLCSFYAMAQSATSGTVEGEVTDQQGAKVAGAVVKLIEQATSTERCHSSSLTCSIT